MSMSIAKERWQTTRPTIKERSKFVFNNDLFSDVKFVVSDSNGENESKRSKQVIPAHKFVLSISSPVFEAMFYGELAETEDYVELPDCEYESLLELFRFMYSDEVNLSGSNVMGVLYLAEKYIVPALADKCTEYLQENLDPLNVFSILPTAQKYEEKNLVDQCWKVIDRQTEEAVKSDEFATIERSLLEAVVERDTLSIEEVNLFKAVNLWATKECERLGLTVTGENKRRILGEPVVKGIRFSVMKQTEFAIVVTDSNILTPEEVNTIFKYYSSAENFPLDCFESKRSGPIGDHNIHGCSRFEFVEDTSDRGWDYDCEISDYRYIDFVVDKDIFLHVLRLFGSENNDYSVTLTLKEGENNPAVVSIKTGIFYSELLENTNGDFYGFEVLFDTVVECKKNTKYQIEALISGPPSWVGNGGISTVVCSEVTFTFSGEDTTGNGTCILFGQFPEVLFSIAT
ncbi:BTB/POZ domain-containing protein 6-like [Oculina patagonica]